MHSFEHPYQRFILLGHSRLGIARADRNHDSRKQREKSETGDEQKR
jgi:hypothetical protein